MSIFEDKDKNLKYEIIDSCPFTGLPVVCNSEWKNITFDTDYYSVTHSIIGDNIVIIKVCGHSDAYVTDRAFEDQKQIVDNYFPKDKKLVFIQDYSELKSTTIEAKKAFIDMFLKNDKVAALIFIGISRYFKILINLSKATNKTAYPIMIVKNYKEALLKAQDYIDSRSLEASSNLIRNYYKELVEEVQGRYCSVSGLEIFCKPEWTDIELTKNYRVSFKILGDSILLTKLEGKCKDNGIQRFLEVKHKILEEVHFNEKPYIELRDFSGVLESPPLEARFLVMNDIKQELEKGNLLQLVVFNFPASFKFIFKLAKVFKYNVLNVTGYREAIFEAQECLRKEKIFNGVKEVEKLENKSWKVAIDDFTMHLDLIGEEILHIEAFGTLRKENIDKIKVLYIKIIKEIEVVSEKGYYRIFHLRSVKNQNPYTLLHYIKMFESFEKRFKCKHSVLYGLPLIIRFFYNMLKPFTCLKYSLVKTLNEAIDLLKRHKEGVDSGIITINACSADEKKYSQKEIDKSIFELSEFLSDIEWNKKGLSIDKNFDTHIFKEIFEMISFIKIDFDNLVKENERARQDLEKEVEIRTKKLKASNDILTMVIQNRLKIEQELKNAKILAETSNNLKTEFISNISHEIRNPLNVIVGLTEIIVNSNSIEDIRQWGHTILQETEVVRVYIDELINESKLQLNNFKIKTEVVDLYSLIQTVIASQKVPAIKKNLHFIAQIDEEVPQYIMSDALCLRQVIINLISNAIKFTSSGSVKTAVRNENNGYLTFEVTDSGIGLRKDKQDKIFERFAEVDKNAIMNFGGTGLGIDVAKSLVEAMNGKIGVLNNNDGGSTFWFSIKLISCTREEISRYIKGHPVKSRVEIKKFNYKILYADDAQENQEVIRMHLESVGCKVKTVIDGVEAYEEALDTKYDLIILDCLMPNLSGTDAAEMIRASNGLNANTIILGLTGNADGKTLNECKDAGMNEVMTKPIRRDALIKHIERWMLSGDKTNTSNKEFSNVVEISTKLSEDLISPIQIEKLLEEFDNKVSFVNNLIKIFIQQTTVSIEAMKKLNESKDYEKIGSLAHKIKGSALNLYAQSVSSKAHKIEIAAKQKEYEFIDEMIKDLELHFIELKDFFDSKESQTKLKMIIGG